MLRLIIVAALLVCVNATMANVKPPPPKWAYNVRMVDIPHKQRGVPLDIEKLKIELAELKAQGVNTIMDHGSLQFIPGLPEDEAQWKLQVDYSVAIPFSKAVKDAGLRLIHHTTSTFVPIEALDAENGKYRPWANLSLETGEIAKSRDYPDAAFMDMNHPDFRALLFQRMAEYARICEVDGWMTDEVEWLPDFYAAGSKEGSFKKFRDTYGIDMPTPPADFNRPEWRKYVTFRFDSGGDFYRALYEELYRVNPDILLSGCVAGISKDHRRIWAMGTENWLKGWNWGFLELEEGHSEWGKRSGHLPTTFWDRSYREMQLYNANGEANGWPTSYVLGYPRTFRKENSELFYIWAQSLTMGLRYWMMYPQYETQWFAWEEKFEQDLIKPKLIGDIGIFFPEWDRDFAVDPPHAYQAWAGVSECLARQNVFADQLVRWHLEDPARLERFRLIILPLSQWLTPKFADTLKTFVARGGTLVAFGEVAVQDPFGEKKYCDKMMNLLGISARTGDVTAPTTFTVKDSINGLPAGMYPCPDGYVQVKPAAHARVLAWTDDAHQPALIFNAVGEGKVFYFTGRMNKAMYNNPYQKKVYQSTNDKRLDGPFGDFIRQQLGGVRRVEVNNLPPKVMANAYDTDGDFDGKFKRTIHILDSFDGFEDGEEIPNPDPGWEGNLPCRFKPIGQRNGGRDIEIILRDIAAVNSARLISPDYSEPKPLMARRIDGAFVVNVPAAELGRYNIIVVDKDD